MKFLVFQHLDVEHPGSFREFWKSDGITWDAVELDQGDKIPNFHEYDALIVMGGPQMAWQDKEHPWLTQEKLAIKHWVEDLKRPFLGICLGHQLLASALNGNVHLGDVSEVGLTMVNLTDNGMNDPLFRDISSAYETFEWHSAEVETLPPDSVVLASNDVCGVQAFRAGEFAYGMQYHVEITETTVPDWRAIPDYAASLEGVLGVGGAEKLENDTNARLPMFNDAAKKLNDNFIEIIKACPNTPYYKSVHADNLSKLYAIGDIDHLPKPQLADAKTAEAFVAKIKEQGFEYIRFEFPDMAGLSRGKTVPVNHVASYMQSGLNLYGGAVALDSYSIPVKNSGYNEEVNFTDCVMIPDTNTLSTIPWLDKTGRVICDTMWYDGRPQMATPRLLLKKILNIADSLGYVVKIGHEYEFYVVDQETRKPLYGGQPIFVTARTHQNETIDQLIQILEKQGIDIITWNSEHGPGQIEINYSALDGIEASDRAFVFKGTVKEYLAKNGLLATFMTKPYAGLSGSCSHFHVSLIDKHTGKNVFLDKTAEHGMSSVMRSFIQGILSHTQASMAVWNPTPNCYRRIRPQTYAPSNISWAVQDRSASVRVKATYDESEHLEVRVPSALSNPYLVAASTIASGLIGVIENLSLKPQSEGPCENNDDYLKLPTALEDALSALKNDKKLSYLLGDEFIKVFLAMKWQEFARLRDEIPQAETNEYFELY